MVLHLRVSLFSASVTERTVCLCLFAPCADRNARSYMSLSCHFHTLLPCTCVDDSCVSLSLACTRAAFPTFPNFASSSFFCGSVFTPAAVSTAFDLALYLVVSGHASTQTCAEGSTGLHVWWSLLALSHSRNTHIWHRLLGGLSRLFIVNLWSLTALCPSCFRGRDCN